MCVNGLWHLLSNSICSMEPIPILPAARFTNEGHDDDVGDGDGHHHVCVVDDDGDIGDEDNHDLLVMLTMMMMLKMMSDVHG